MKSENTNQTKKETKSKTIAPKNKKVSNKPIKRSVDDLGIENPTNVLVGPFKKEGEAVQIKIAGVKEEVELANEEVKKISEAEEIWEKVKNIDLGLFGIPGQTVNKYCTPMNIDEKACYLKYKVSSVLPVLEENVRSLGFDVSPAPGYSGGFLIVSKNKKE